MLKLGATGPAVERLQRRLRLAGHSHFEATGTFDAETLWAVERFQADKGLAVDGVVGPKTIAALRFFAPLLLGIDISQHQRALTNEDMRRLVREDPAGIPRLRKPEEQGIRFAIVRATIGEHGEDETWRSIVARLAEAGVKYIGLYHLLKAWQPIGAQAWRLTEALTEAGEACRANGAGVAFPMVDVEWTLERGREDDQIEKAGEATLAFASAMSSSVQRPVIYTAPAFVAQGAAKGEPWPAALAAYPLALAHFKGPGRPVSAHLPLDLTVPAPWDFATIGQFDGDGGLRAPSGLDLDFNWYEGTEADFEREICAPFCETPT